MKQYISHENEPLPNVQISLEGLIVMVKPFWYLIQIDRKSILHVKVVYFYRTPTMVMVHFTNNLYVTVLSRELESIVKITIRC